MQASGIDKMGATEITAIFNRLNYLLLLIY